MPPTSPHREAQSPRRGGGRPGGVRHPQPHREHHGAPRRRRWPRAGPGPLPPAGSPVSATTTSRGVRAGHGPAERRGDHRRRARRARLPAADGVAPGATGIVRLLHGRCGLVLRSDPAPRSVRRSPSTAGGCAKGVSVCPRSSSSAPSLQTPWLGLLRGPGQGLPARGRPRGCQAARTHRLRRGRRANPDAEHGSLQMTAELQRAGSRRRWRRTSLGSTPTSAPESRATLSAAVAPTGSLNGRGGDGVVAGVERASGRGTCSV